MARKRHTAEEIVAKLRQVDVLTSQGRPVAEAVRSIGVTEVTYYRWRQEIGGLKGDQVKRLKELEAENTRIGVVPFEGTDRTCVIACSWEAKLHGVKNVMNVNYPSSSGATARRPRRGGPARGAKRPCR